jgi:hypothetical protein
VGLATVAPDNALEDITSLSQPGTTLAAQREPRCNPSSLAKRHRLIGYQKLPTAAISITHLQFRRFAGCPIYDLHLCSIRFRLDEITAIGVREVLVSHSTPAELRNIKTIYRFRSLVTLTRGSTGNSVWRPR